jgi:hypothetical protein
MPSLFHYLEGMCDASIFTIPWLMNRDFYIPLFLCIAVMLLIEWFQRNKQHGLEVIDARKYKWLRVACYYVLILFIISNAGTEQTFIYFQF